jgi:mannose/fructose/N-acetylgalactosamine-specific phosphotransferase system component IID
VTGVLIGAVLLFVHFPVILLTVLVVVLFIGLTADPYYTHAIWYGIMNTLGSNSAILITSFYGLVLK